MIRMLFIVGTILFGLSQSAWALEMSADTLRLGLTLERFAACKSQWQQTWPNPDIRFDEQILDDSQDIPALKAEYVIRSFPSIVTLTARQERSDSIWVELRYETVPDEAIRTLWTTNIRATLLQSCGKIPSNVAPIHKKSHAVHFGLTMLNMGLGYYYSSSQSPTVTKLQWFDWANAGFDLVFTVLLFTGTEQQRQLAGIVLPLYKGMGLLRHLKISTHNDLVKTGWQFYF